MLLKGEQHIADPLKPTDTCHDALLPKSWLALYYFMHNNFSILYGIWGGCKSDAWHILDTIWFIVKYSFRI
ncbi:hypothetical protein SLEP1_g59936 [Rubroshorea leprosula]|uniref:Uncharacterized protein n=1 Tax=Rubroshorea leprosula TaxID=152421 RepID=A0AAV5MX14_9ROSI|nr:hypothetical protein SLEP1_g59936 [Rubroshorea leprosula]